MSRTSKKISKSYVHVPQKTPFSGKTIGQEFNYVANNNPDKEMYVFYVDQERKTYRQMQQESLTFAGALLQLGLKKGDTLGVWGGNHYEWLLTYWAALQLGILTVHLRIDFPLDVQQKIINKLGISVLVLMRSPSDLYEKLCKIVPELLTNPADNLECKSTPKLKYVINAGNDKCSGSLSINYVMDMGKNVDRAKVTEACEKVDIDDNAVVIFTSGSTGFPKGVTHTHKSLYVFRQKLWESTGYMGYENKHTSKVRYGLINSFGGMNVQLGALLPVYTATCTSIIVAPSYDKEILAKAIQDERVTVAFVLIHHLNDILNLPNIYNYDLSSLELCVTGGSIIPSSLLQRTKKISKHVLLAYGGSEGFMSTQSLNDPIEILEGQACYPVEGSEVKIIGDDEQILPINTPGEICFRSEMLFRYYWGEEEKTKAAKRPNGWYHTGDLGTLDVNGYLRIVGRKAERIIREGINIAPGDLEKVLDQHPGVNNVMVVGVPDLRTSEEVCACIRLHPSTNVTADELRDFCRGKVSDFLVPKYVLFVEAKFPTTETGKFDRKKIAEEAKTILGL